MDAAWVYHRPDIKADNLNPWPAGTHGSTSEVLSGENSCLFCFSRRGIPQYRSTSIGRAECMPYNHRPFSGTLRRTCPRNPLNCIYGLPFPKRRYLIRRAEKFKRTNRHFHYLSKLASGQLKRNTTHSAWNSIRINRSHLDTSVKCLECSRKIRQSKFNSQNQQITTPKVWINSRHPNIFFCRVPIK